MDTSTVSGPLRQLVAVLHDLMRTHAVAAQLVVCTRGGVDVTAMRRFLDDAGIDLVHLEERGRFDWRIIRTYRRLLADPNIDVVQTHGYKPTIQIALQRLMGRRRPWIAFFHGRTYETRAVQLFDRMAIRCARLADRIVVVAASQRTLFHGSVPVRHIPNAVTAPHVVSISERTRVPRSSPTIVYVGRLSPEKGVDLLVHAMHRLRQWRPDARLRIAGDGPTRPIIEALIADLALVDAIEWCGHVADPAPLYAAADVLCLPSRSEGMPNVVLEAIAAGLPVVATDVGDVALLVTAPLGRVVAPGDPLALASALRDELSCPRGSEFDEAQQELLQRMSRTNRAKALRSLYDEVVAAAD